jgi:hypothetical protein
VFQHALFLYPYRKDLKKFRFIPPLGLELIGKVIEPYTRALDIIDLRYESKRTADFLRPQTDMVCFSIKKYIINARLEIARRPDVIRKMELAGFAILLLGIESAQDKALEIYVCCLF